MNIVYTITYFIFLISYGVLPVVAMEQRVISEKVDTSDIIDQTKPSTTSRIYALKARSDLDFVLEYYLKDATVPVSKLKKITDSVGAALEEGIVLLPKNHGARLAEHKPKFEEVKAALPAELECIPLAQVIQLLEKIDTVKVENSSEKIVPPALQLQRLYQVLSQVGQKEDHYIKETIFQLEELTRQMRAMNKKNHDDRIRLFHLINQALPPSRRKFDEVFERKFIKDQGKLTETVLVESEEVEQASQSEEEYSD